MVLSFYRWGNRGKLERNLPKGRLQIGIDADYWIMWRRHWHPTPVLLSEKSHGWRSLVGCSPWGHWGSDTTERLHFHFSLSCIGEGNGNPLQGSCLENSRDGGAWRAAIYGVAQSRTWLEQLSSSGGGSSIELWSTVFLIYQDYTHTRTSISWIWV